MVNLYGKPLRFLSGSQASLDSLQGSTSNQESMIGTFYLTDDTHRLYIGIEDCTWVQSNSAPTGQTGNTVDSAAYYKKKDGTYIKVADYDALEAASLPQPQLESTAKKTYYKTGRTIKPVPVNASINTVASLSALNEISTKVLQDQLNSGSPMFYYVVAENILCMYGRTDNPNTGDYGWIQINSDTYISSITTAVNGGIATITLNASNTNENNNNPSFTITTGKANTLGITKSDDNIVFTVPESELTTGQTGSTDVLKDTAKINLTGPVGIYNKTINLTKGSYMGQFGEKAGTITINADSQQITEFTPSSSASAYAITLKQKNGNSINTQSIILPMLSYGQTLTQTALGQQMSVYTIAEVDRLISGARSDAAQTANAMRYKGVIGNSTDPSTATVIAYGGSDTTTTGDTTDTYIKDSLYYEVGTTRPTSDTYYYQDSTGEFKTGSSSTTTGANGENPSGKWYKKAKAVVGDTYRISQDMTSALTSAQRDCFSANALSAFNGREDEDQIKLHKGDLIIANSDYKWDIVPAGDEPQYVLATVPDTDASKNYLQLKDLNSTVTSTHELITDDNLSIVLDNSVDTPSITIKHIDQTTKTTNPLETKSFTQTNKYTSFSGTTPTLTATTPNAFNTIGSIELDKYGHITKVTAARFNQNKIASITPEVTNSNAGLNFKIEDSLATSTTTNLGFNFQNPSTDNGGIKFQTSVESNTATIAAQMYWGHF